MGFLKINFFSTVWEILKEAVVRFTKQDTLTQSAALAYYTVFSLPPMLFIVFWLDGLIFDESAIKVVVFEKMEKIIGEDGSGQIMATIEKISFQKPNWWQSLIGIVTLLFTSSTVFIAMQSALNRIFEVRANHTLKQSIWALVRGRFLSISMLAIISFLLVLSLLITSLINKSGKAVEGWIGLGSQWLTYFDSMLLSLAGLTFLFAIMFRYLPDTRMKWRDTMLGAFITAILFMGSKWVVAIFVGTNDVANMYSAAGSILVMMLWVYFTSAIFLFGATITRCRIVHFEGDEINGEK